MDKINIEDINRETLAYFGGDELARDAWVEKYCLQDSEDNYYELTPDDMHRRMSKKFARIENQYPNPIDEETIYNLFKDFKYLIPQGSPMAGIGNPFKYSTLSSCYVIADPYDSYAGILKTEQEQIFLMKTRGGVGFSLHSLRPQNMPTSSVSNKSSGLVLFGERYSNGTREVAQDGRRGALMLSTRITHPDIEQFIDAKLDLKKITGANISIMITDDFMESLSNGQMYETYFEGDTGKVSIEKNSKHVWGKIVHNAWKSAEPGILFWDNILNESIPSLYGDDWKETSTNPCSELPLCPYDSCRLLAINLFSYVKKPFTKKAYFDFNLFGGHVMMAQKFLDDMIDLEIERIDRIVNKIKADNQPEDLKYVELNLWEKIRKKALDGRRTGLGITAVGDMLAALNLRYGTVKASDFEVKVTKALAIKSYLMSVLLAKDRGSFPIWDYEKEKDSVFINRLIKETFGDMSHWGTFEYEYRKYGRRNIANLTIAPTGTTSLMAQTTSGIEPLFLPKYKRRKKVNKETENIFVDEVGDIWEEYDVIHSKFQMWFDINWRSLFPGWLTSTDEEKPILKDLNEDIFQMVFEQSPYYKATSNDVDWLEKVRMQGRVQKFIDHSISCTVNVPKEATEELISQIYQTAWESKCKGLTVYRDGSRTGILVNNDSEVNLKYNDATKRGEVLPIDIYHKTALKKNWLVIVGLKKDKPYEIFAIHDIENHIFPTAITNGTLTKVKSGVYKLVGEYSGKEYIVENIIDKMSNEVGTNTRKYSMMLRHGIHPKYIVSEIDEYSLITSFDKVVGRVLKKYFDQETKGKCPECGGELVFREGCISCISCSYSLCT